MHASTHAYSTRRQTELQAKCACTRFTYACVSYVDICTHGFPPPEFVTCLYFGPYVCLYVSLRIYPYFLFVYFPFRPSVFAFSGRAAAHKSCISHPHALFLISGRNTIKGPGVVGSQNLGGAKGLSEGAPLLRRCLLRGTGVMVRLSRCNCTRNPNIVACILLGGSAVIRSHSLQQVGQLDARATRPNRVASRRRAGQTCPEHRAESTRIVLARKHVEEGGYGGTEQVCASKSVNVHRQGCRCSCAWWGGGLMGRQAMSLMSPFRSLALHPDSHSCVLP